ncbi:hypothetical protein TWF696_006867 [Orbilia brochopaga]|uniref:Nephrocystin 3-like N-terminal domain-containing protein n=1 Tax=Orbilia brochopaga TaxID=3140254 RepID=A0AAV9UQJ8_9PEZI
MTTDHCHITGDIGSDGGNIFIGKTTIQGANVTFNRSSRDEQYECLRHLRQTDPESDIERIKSENQKGLPLTGSYEWILRNAAFKNADASGSGILWIRGNPGKGKTMIMIGLIDQYSRRSRKRNQESAPPYSLTISHFICESQDNFHNNATSVLRGLLYMLLTRRPELLRYLQDAFKMAGPRLFEDGAVDLFQTLKRVLLDILDDDRLGSICFFLDALDECEIGLDVLLDLITTTSQKSNVRWVVSSRKQEIIVRKLTTKCLAIDLEENHLNVQKAIEMYIDEKVRSLDYGPSTSDTVSKYLKDKSEGTFLWVHLVFKMLADVPEWDVVTELEQVPPGLDAFYERMFGQVSRRKDAALCYQVLGIIVLAYRPMQLVEVAHSLQVPVNLARFLQDQKFPTGALVEILEKLINNCGSFLSVRDQVVSTVHKSAHDFLRQSKREDIFVPSEYHLHATIGEKSVQLLSKYLKRDILGLQRPGILDTELPSNIPLKPEFSDIQYAISFWASHLKEAHNNVVAESTSKSGLDAAQIAGIAGDFLRVHFLHWLEALSLLGRLSDAFQELDSLATLQNPCGITISALIEETIHFLRRNRMTIETTPLQLYLGLSLFYSAQDSRLRDHFKKNLWIRVKILPEFEPGTSQDCLQFWEQSGKVTTLAFSAELLASGGNQQVVLWDVKRGYYRHILRIPSFDRAIIQTVGFSTDGDKVFGIDDDSIVYIWDCNSGHLEKVITCRADSESWKKFRHIRSILTSSGNLSTFAVSDIFSNLDTNFDLRGWQNLRHLLPGRTDTELETISDIQLCQWNISTATGERSNILLETSYLKDGDAYNIQDITDSGDGNYLLATKFRGLPGSGNDEFQLWNTIGRLREAKWKVQLERKRVSDSKFISTPTSTHVILTTEDGTVEVWNISGNNDTYIGSVNTLCWKRLPRVEFLPALNILITTYRNSKILLFQFQSPADMRTISKHFWHRDLDAIDEIKASSDHRFLVSMSTNLSRGILRLWNLQKYLDELCCLDLATSQDTKGGQSEPEKPNAHSEDSASEPNYHAKSPENPQQPDSRLQGGNDIQGMEVSGLKVSRCGKLLAIHYRSGDKSFVQIRYADTGGLSACVHSGDMGEVTSMAFLSGDSDALPLFMTTTTDLRVRFWDLEKGLCIKWLHLTDDRHWPIMLEIPALAELGIHRSHMKEPYAISDLFTTQLSPDSKLLACCLDASIYDANIDANITLSRSNEPNLGHQSDYDPGSIRTVALYQISTAISLETDSRTVDVTRVRCTELPYIRRRREELVSTLKFSPDNSILATVTNNRILSFCSINKPGEWTRVDLRTSRVLITFEFLPDSTKIAVIYRQIGESSLFGPRLSIVDTISGTVLRNLDLRDHSIFSRRLSVLSLSTVDNVTYLRADRAMFPIAQASDLEVSADMTQIYPGSHRETKPEEIDLSKHFLPNMLELSGGHAWVLFNQQRLLWIPHDFRAWTTQGRWLVHSDKIIIESEPGKIIILKFDLDQLEDLFGSRHDFARI